MARREIEGYGSNLESVVRRRIKRRGATRILRDGQIPGGSRIARNHRQ
jgi:hypothetical protein